MKLSGVMKNTTPHSSATYELAMKHRSDGQLQEGKGPKPTTPADHKIHLGHILDSAEYNLRHDFDHSTELAFDFGRLMKDSPGDAKFIVKQTKRFLNPVWSKMGLKLSEVGRKK
jgi:hypothetical protein